MNAIQEVYNKATNYLMGNNSFTAKTIINECYDATADTPTLMGLTERCAHHLNWWNDETLEEHIADADIIIEEITGILGAYLE